MMKVVTVNFLFGNAPITKVTDPPRKAGERLAFGGGGGYHRNRQVDRNPGFTTRFSKQELIPIDSEMYMKDFRDFLKNRASKILHAAVMDGKFEKRDDSWRLTLLAE